MAGPEPLGSPGTYWDGRLMHEGYGSIVQGLCFKRCENLRDPFERKSEGFLVVAATPTCLACIVWVEEP